VPQTRGVDPRGSRARVRDVALGLVADKGRRGSRRDASEERGHCAALAQSEGGEALG
jgi:hypothetical protein